MKTAGAFAGVIIAILVVVGLIYGAIHLVSGRGGTSNADTYVLDGSITTGTFVSAGTTLALGTASGGTGVSQAVSTGSCNSATSTVFAVANPYSATSTAELIMLSGIGNATTSSLTVGTSTRTTGLTSALYGILANVSISTSSSFAISGGVRNGPIGNIVDAGSASVMRIIVGPNETVGAYSTTTATGAGAAGFVNTFGSCTYKVRWTN